MNLLTLAAVVIFIGVAVLAKATPFPRNPQIKGQTDTITTKPSPSPSPSPSASPNPSSPPSPSPVSSPSTTGDQLSQFIYPNSHTVAASDSKVMLSTVDTPDQVTQWYENLIRSTGFNVKSFVTTSANDKVVNKLVGASATLEVSIEINRLPTDSTTNITITISNK